MSGLVSPDTTRALDVIFGEYFRPYQLEFLTDWSPRRLVLKARRVGLSEVAAFDVVMTTSGLWEFFDAPVVTHNYSVISKRDTEAQQFVRYCKRWIDVLAEDPATAPFVELAVDSKTALQFKRSGRRIQSDTQSEMAGRGQEGHLLKDEAAFYKFAKDIVAGADKIPLSDPRLRLTEFSTPNGTSGMGEVFYVKWTDTRQFSDYSRHRIDIHRAIDDGFPITAEHARTSCFSDEEFRQEFCCEFIGSTDEYFDRELLMASTATKPGDVAPDMTVCGIDVASVVDLTAVVVLRRYPGAVWLEDVYLIRGVPYATGSELGQEHIVAGLLWALKPSVSIIDASADGSELYGRLVGLGCKPLIPHTFHSNGRQWKETWVPRMRQALEDGSLRISDERARVFQRGFAKVGSVTPETAQTFVETAFHTHHFDALQHDFMRIRRKLLQTGVTFDSPRDAEGHGDSFWAGAMGFSAIWQHQTHQTEKSAFRSLLNAAQPANIGYEGYL